MLKTRCCFFICSVAVCMQNTTFAFSEFRIAGHVMLAGVKGHNVRLECRRILPLQCFWSKTLSD